MLLNEMEIFYHVVEQHSFSQAAERLGVSKSFISKRINKLEAALKVRLIVRSTRKLTLTETGENFYQYCKKVVEQGEQAYSMIHEFRGKPSGVLKISIPPALALNFLSPLLTDYLAKYPEVTLDIRLESRLVNLIEEGYDLALRSAKLESSNLIAQKIFTIKNVICAAPKYFSSRPMPLIATDLNEHNCAVYSDTKATGKIQLERHGKHEEIYLKGNLLSNQLELIKQLTVSGNCIAVLPEFMISEELKNGILLECLTDYTLPTSDLYALYPEKIFMLPKLNHFMQMLKGYLLS